MDFIAIAAGQYHSLGLKVDGSVVGWGYNDCGACDAPLPNTDFIAIAAGGCFSLGLKTDGSIVAWGYNYWGQCDVPVPNMGYIAVEAGYMWSLGLKANGSIVAWGTPDNVPSPNTDFIAIAAGSYSLGLKADGSIVAWTDYPCIECNAPLPNTGFTAIATGSGHSLGLKGDQGEPNCPYYLAGDFNDDCKVDFRDFAILARAWLSNDGNPNWNPACDISEPEDSIINWKDIAAFCENWLIDCNTNPSCPACIPK